MEPLLGGSSRDVPVERLVRLLISASSLMSERIARVEALANSILSRIKDGAELTPSDRSGSAAVLQLDMSLGRMYCGDRWVDLTASEARVARELLQASPGVLTRDDLHQALYGVGWLPGKRSLDVHVARLRRKLAEVTDLLRVEAVRGRGYRLRSGPPGGVTVLLDGDAD